MPRLSVYEGGILVMPEIIFESNEGIYFEKSIIKKGKCKIAFRRIDGKRAIKTYYFNDVPGLDSPLVNWENLYYAAWAKDEAYLHTAVQRGLKPLAAITFSANDDKWVEKIGRPDLTTETQVEEIISKIKRELPNDCVFYEKPLERHSPDYRQRAVYICKVGSILEYIDADEVFKAYNRLGIFISSDAKQKITKALGTPLKYFADNEHRVYWNSVYPSQLIVIGLVLGYPLESTAYLIEKDCGTIVNI